MYLVSACLVGINCRYNGESSADEELIRLMKEGKAIPVCPEVFGGLPTPRTPCEIVKLDDTDKVMDREGNDRTSEFHLGAQKTLEICKILGIDTVVLKFRSPSCGCGKIYDGSFCGNVIDGNGITARLLLKNNIKVYSEENYKENIKL